MEDAVKKLAATQLELTEPPWRDTLWDSSANKMKPQASRLHYNLFLHMVGESVDFANYDLQDNYRKAVGDEQATLPAAMA